MEGDVTEGALGADAVATGDHHAVLDGPDERGLELGARRGVRLPLAGGVGTADEHDGSGRGGGLVALELGGIGAGRLRTGGVMDAPLGTGDERGVGVAFGGDQAGSGHKGEQGSETHGEVGVETG